MTALTVHPRHTAFGVIQDDSAYGADQEAGSVTVSNRDYARPRHCASSVPLFA